MRKEILGAGLAAIMGISLARCAAPPRTEADIGNKAIEVALCKPDELGEFEEMLESGMKERAVVLNWGYVGGRDMRDVLGIPKDRWDDLDIYIVSDNSSECRLSDNKCGIVTDKPYRIVNVEDGRLIDLESSLQLVENVPINHADIGDWVVLDRFGNTLYAKGDEIFR